VASQHGGAGLGFVELALLLQEAGRALLPVPLLSSALGAWALELAGSEPQRRRWLPEIAAGRCRTALALLEQDGRSDAAGIAATVRPAPGGWRVDGVKRFVLDADGADRFLVAARSGGRGEEGVTLALVDARAVGLQVLPTACVDLTRRVAELCFEAVTLREEHLLGRPGEAWPVLSRLLDAARTGLAADSLGVAERVLELSLEHAGSREQFGRPIGSFQAVQHRCADMLVRVELARSAVWRAAWSLVEQEPAAAHLAASMAKAVAGEACREVAAAGIQVHGGLGFTWEQDLHLYYKRAKANELLFGDVAACRELVAAALLRAAGAA
jgi:alkylation response protein AidB-like acyl-CoA dehydrogenase